MNNLKFYIQLMRWHRPIGIGLLLWPTLWAVWIAGDGHPSLSIIIIFVLGAIIMRSAGCVINDIADRHIDRHIARTSQRPLTIGQIKLSEAIVLFLILLVIAASLLFWLNNYTRILAVIACLLAILYPFTKRWTHWPQIIFALTWSMGILMAFSAQTNSLPAVSWLIFVINSLWSFMYDTQYAMADRAEDLLIGVKSSAIGLGRFDRLALAILQIVIIALLILLGYYLNMKWIYFISIAITAFVFIYQNLLIRHRESKKCFIAFLSNQWIGLIIFIGILCQYKL